MTTTDHPPIVFVRDEVRAMLTAEPADFTQAEIRAPLLMAEQDMAEGMIASQPIYMVPVNPFATWTVRAAGAAMGTWIAAGLTFLLHSPLFWWAVASAVTVTLLFAWVLAGQELYERNPKKFQPAP
jgi:hypothetical protein